MCLGRDNFLPAVLVATARFRYTVSPDRQPAAGKPARTANAAWHCRCSSQSVRPLLLVCLTVAFLLSGLGRLASAGDLLAISGVVSATDQEASEGYYPVGDDALVVVKQGSGVQLWLEAHRGQKIRITLEPAGIQH